MEFSVEIVSLLLAIWGAGLSSWLAFRSWIRNRTRIGLDISRDFRVGQDSGAWEWIALEVAIRNASDRSISIVEYGMTIVHPDGTPTFSTTAHHNQMPNGDSVLEDPHTFERTAVEVHLEFLETPVNLAPRSSAQGWIAFHFDHPISRNSMKTHDIRIILVDQHRKKWGIVLNGLGESNPYRSQRFELIRTR